MPTVSVLMTVYNSRRYLEEAVDSILAQTLRDFEFIIIDDGSTDGTLQMLREYERRDSRIRLFERPHMGYVRQLNFGLRQCQGKYIARMDADDIVLPERFALQVALLEEQPDVAVCGGAYELIDAEGRFLRREWPALDDAALQESALSGCTPLPHPSAMISRAHLDRVGGYDVTVETAEDNDLWLRLGEVARLACVPEVVLKYRQHDKSISETRAAEQTQKLRVGCERAYARRGLTRQFVTPPAWRPVGEEGRYRFLLQYGWWAFNFGQRRTALIYGLKALVARPRDRSGYSLLITSLVKPTPAPPQPPAAIRLREKASLLLAARV